MPQQTANIMAKSMPLVAHKPARPARRTCLGHPRIVADRSSGLRKMVRSYPRRASRRLVLRALSSPFFPSLFFARNLRTLTTEPGWQRLPVRLRKASTLSLLLERSRFFLGVGSWREEHRPLPAAPAVPSAISEDSTITAYCDHCGACCEIASGLPVFPEGVLIPVRWQRVFGQGLGRWHRFCPFLWQERPEGRSFCAIHPWRPLACRAFEQEECVFLKMGVSPHAAE